MGLFRRHPTRRPPILQFTLFSTIAPVVPEVADSVNNFTLPSRNQKALARLDLKDLSQEARLRLKWFDWYRNHGENASLTCRHFGIARQTFYRWKKRYDPKHLYTLEDRSSVPHKRRHRMWTTAQVLAVQRLRESYPWCGKDKLKVFLKRDGILLSASTIGRILLRLKSSGQLREAVRKTMRRRRQWRRQYAVRKPKSYQPLLPGDIIQIDTMDVRPEPGIILKQFTSVDVVSRWSVAKIVSNATALMASKMLDEIIERMPFPVRAIQIDGGSEFMADFEALCKKRQVALFLLPPYSPKLNGRVERANRTYREEFYNCSTATPTVAGFRDDLRRYEHFYNDIRPHQALGYLTPAEFLATLNPTKPQEDLSRTS